MHLVNAHVRAMFCINVRPVLIFQGFRPYLRSMLQLEQDLNVKHLRSLTPS